MKTITFYILTKCYKFSKISELENDEISPYSVESLSKIQPQSERTI